MCGINGCIPPSSNIHLMNEAIRHRGPDGLSSYSNKQLSLGHARLSILDLTSNATQPMGLFPDGSISHENLADADFIVVFNGEIYNYVELREELGIKNIATTGDTGVLLHAYKKWGVNCVNKFNGMWAFAIYDKKKNNLFLSRDRLGQKPLYYFLKDGIFTFSSELKAIRKMHVDLVIDKESVELYFSMGFIPSPKSIYESVFKLEAGHSLIYSFKTQSIKKYRYFSISSQSSFLSKKEIKEQFNELLKSAVDYRLISDVPVGAFLSGGVDSSSIVSYIKKKKGLHTFSIGFEGEKYDETPYINQVKTIFKTLHHHKYYTKKDFLKDVEVYAEVYDEPFGDYSGFPTLKVSELAKKNVTVVLSGDGGDEIFGGYPTHILGRRMDIIRKVPKFIRLLISKISARQTMNSTSSLFLLTQACKLSLLPKENFYSDSLSDQLYKPESYKQWSKKKLRHCLNLSNNNLGDALRLHDLLYRTLADNFLTKVDRASMHWGVEVRSPYLDYRFIEFSQKIKPNHKIGLFAGKLILKNSLQSLLPKNILYRSKQGFTPPLEDWVLDDNIQKYLKLVLEKIKFFSPELYSFFATKAFINSDRPYKIYLIRLFLFGKWLDRWVELK